MFGLSVSKMIAETVMNACVNYANELQSALEKLYTIETEVNDEELLKVAKQAIVDYKNRVFDSLWSLAKLSSPNNEARLRLAMMSPQIAGLPDGFDLDHIAIHGFSAGATYAIFRYALTGKPLKNTKDFRACSELNHFQQKQINIIVRKFE